MYLLLALACTDHKLPLEAPEDTGGDDTGEPANPAYGTGADGALTVDAAVNLATYASEGRSAADIVVLRVAAIDGATVTLVDTPDGLGRGDEVLLIDLQGPGDGVGTFEFGRLEAVTGVLTLEAPVTASFANPEEHVVVVQRVPNYTDVTVTSAGRLTIGAWDGDRGGVLAFRASGALVVEAGGVVSVDELGYAGGQTGTCRDCDGWQGESLAGTGGGDHVGGEGYNGSSGEYNPNDGGGGAHVTGAGGEHAGGATDGDAWMTGVQPPLAGETYGDDALTRVNLGSGGGGVWNDGSATAGPGGGGGGLLVVTAAHATIAAGGLVARGGTTYAWATGTYTYGAGGGAGGTIWLQSPELSLEAGALDATGGFGETSHERFGGDGGVGRIRIDCTTINGSSCAPEGFAGLSSPEPGWVTGAP